MKRHIGKIVLGLVVCVLLYGLLFPNVIWDGGVTRTITVTVYAKNNGALSGARVSYKYPPNDLTGGGTMNPDFFDRVIWQGVTDAAGHITFSQMFGAGGGTSFGCTRGRFVLANNIRVEAQGFRPFESPLE